MAIATNDRVKFVYVEGSSLPVVVETDTIYFVSGSGQLYVGNILIADKTQYDTIASTYIAQADVKTLTTQEISDAVDTAFDNVFNTSE